MCGLKIGRHLFDGKNSSSVLQKLEEAFALGSTDQEACVYADISPSALYEYQRKNTGFLERKQALKSSPVLKARMTVVRSLENDPKVAMWYLEKKRRKEFGNQAQEDLDEPRPRLSEHTVNLIEKYNPEAALRCRMQYGYTQTKNT
ncbi:MAG: hypothetical protein PHC53_01710 [Patescibacteria group bacterium]|nr:hypothetical protein [Patescibacteria group bacterium]